ncbi:MAG: hypothetical protein KKB30_02060 [Proteobacteria bacterium]|nr:hypothetical protein [Pseudomonadota bacterium]MBU1715207.1 hypothetical protein [Pseudomonadota bacterium]
MKFINKKTIGVFTILALFIFVACGGGKNDATDNTGSASLHLVWQDEYTGNNDRSLNLAVNDNLIPAGVVKIRVIFWADGRDQIQADFPVEAHQGTINDIPVGLWAVTVDGIDSRETTLYYGQINDITITGGQTTACGTVIMEEVTNQGNDIDNDHDGYTENQGDCDDLNNTIHPGAIEICGDGIDQDCFNGDLICATDPTDLDEDGYTVIQGDCNDNDSSIYPGAYEYCEDGTDQDCNGSDLACPTNPNDIDDDLDGYTEYQGDCNDYDNSIHPDAPEICGDGIDQDCAGGDLVCATTGTVISAGQIWMDKNLGASRVAISFNDSEAYGDLYQWGRGTDGHEKRTSFTTTTLSSSDTPGHGSFITIDSSPYDWRSPQNDNLWQGVNGTNNPCLAGFRLPTETEWQTERALWSSADRSGAFVSSLKLVSAGHRDRYDGSIDGAGTDGGYWSSTVNGDLDSFLYFDSGVASILSNRRAVGFSVRCIKD